MAEIQEALLRHVRPAPFELVERAMFHTLVRNPTETVRDFIVRLQRQASMCNSEGQLGDAPRDRLVAGIKKPELQRKLLPEKDISFQHLPVVCETTEQLNPGAISPVTPILNQTPPIPGEAT